MAEKERKQLSGTQRLLEVGLLFTCAFAFFLILSLISFNIADPGWSQTGYAGGVQNWGGAVGAYFSDVLLLFFGIAAYSIPFVVAFIGWLVFQRIYHLLAIDYLTLALKLVGFFMLYSGLTGLLSMNSENIYEFSAGGLIGDVISANLLPYFNFIGTSLLLLSLTLTGFVLMTGVSLLNFIDYVGEKTIRATEALFRLPAKITANFGPNTEPASDSLKQATVSEDDDNKPVKAQSENKSENKKAKVTAKETPQVEHQINDIDFDDEISLPSFSAAPEEDSFVPIDDLIEGPVVNSVQQEVEESEINAAFEPVDKLEVADDPQEPMQADKIKPASGIDKYKGMPSIELLDRPDKATNPVSQEDLDTVSRLVEAKLLDFNIEAKVVEVLPGPVITMLELDLAPGVKVSKITNLSKDLARSMSVSSVRVVEVIPGKSVIGLEIPNQHREIVHFSEVVACPDFDKSQSTLTMVLGKDISGEAVVVDLAKMPHLLVAGTTGSGKSVGVNTMIVSLLYKSTPDDVRLIMIDPKMLELSVYEGIPHLLTEVVTDMKDAANALRWCVGEMERRYKLMSALGVRNLKGYNQKVKQAIEDGAPLTDPLWSAGDSMDETAPELEKLPSIVVVVDEFADMIMVVGKKVEELIARIAQKARAAGIHLILATQRPSTDVITGLIKANIPTRMAFQVQGRVNSRVILDQQGAEQLLGMGDMLYLPPGKAVPTRVHGAFIDDHEVHAVVDDWKSRGEPKYIDEILSGEMTQETLLPGEQPEGEDQELDALYDEALAFVTESRKASISGVQRKFRIGYNRAARLIEQMEASGVVSSPGHNGNREVLAPPPVRHD